MNIFYILIFVLYPRELRLVLKQDLGNSYFNSNNVAIIMIIGILKVYILF